MLCNLLEEGRSVSQVRSVMTNYRPVRVAGIHVYRLSIVVRSPKSLGSNDEYFDLSSATAVRPRLTELSLHAGPELKWVVRSRFVIVSPCLLLYRAVVCMVCTPSRHPFFSTLLPSLLDFLAGSLHRVFVALYTVFNLSATQSRPFTHHNRVAELLLPWSLSGTRQLE